MRSRGLPQTLGTASALLTAQALQHGHGTAKWLLQAPGTGGGGGKQSGGGGGSGSGSAGGSGTDVQLPETLVDSCLLGRGDPKACMSQLVGADSGDHAAQQNRPPGTDAFNVVLAGLAVRGCTQEAFQLFGHMKQLQQEAEQRLAAAARTAGSAGGAAARTAARAAAGRRQAMAPPPGAPDHWTYSLLLFAALNAPKEQQLELTLRAVQEAR